MVQQAMVQPSHGQRMNERMNGKINMQRRGQPHRWSVAIALSLSTLSLSALSVSTWATPRAWATPKLAQTPTAPAPLLPELSGAELSSPVSSNTESTETPEASSIPAPTTPITPPKPLPEPILDIGIVQRFGEKKSDTVVLNAVGGDRFTVKFETGGQPQELTTTQVTLDVVMTPLPEPELSEKVVLSSHRSFESAEDSANYWQEQGIEVEIAQPQQWQVWGKRSVYRTPLLRRLLLQNVQSNGAKGAFLETQVYTEKPQAAFVVDGFRYHRDRFEIDAGRDQAWLDVNARETAKRLYGGDFRVQTNAYGTYTLVNEVPIETYLRGVVPYEIGLGAPRTTIEAQAILARTYSLRNLRRFAIDNYELCADTQCQVYWGVSGAADVTDRAIAATRGQVLTYNNELVDALYSSTTGGITARFSDVWNGPDRPYLKAVVDSVHGIWDLDNHDLSSEANIRAFLSLKEGFNEDGWEALRWRRDGTLLSLANDVRAYLKVVQHPLVNFSTVEKLEITERSPSGRVQQLVVTTDLGEIELGKDEVIRALYPPRSTLFYIEPIYEEVAQLPSNSPSHLDVSANAVVLDDTSSPISDPALIEGDEGDAIALSLAKQDPQPPQPQKILKGYAFVGGGFGHGVGMSQTGAYKLGRLGWGHDRILSFYYPGTTLQPLHDQLVFWPDAH
ncbi:MAG: SpoIID/LytB domain-containing protein [Merismopedia sp. SIO2A8]|nr:SpoIID/LytB domain-containing protein [Merismopedia sp. SIO2A8]